MKTMNDENGYETKIKEVSERAITYTIIKGATKVELFDNIYMYFKSNQYCWQVNRSFEDKNLKKNMENGLQKTVKSFGGNTQVEEILIKTKRS